MDWVLPRQDVSARVRAEVDLGMKHGLIGLPILGGRLAAMKQEPTGLPTPAGPSAATTMPAECRRVIPAAGAMVSVDSLAAVRAARVVAAKRASRRAAMIVHHPVWQAARGVNTISATRL